MTTTNLKFDDDGIRKIYRGEKTCTTRDEPKGKPGDTFMLVHPDTLGIRTFKLKWIGKWSLAWIAKNKFKEEGYGSPEAFRDAIDKFYSPMKSNKIMYLHEFEEIPNYST